MVDTHGLRAAFARSLSAMYGREVPAYTTLVDASTAVNTDHVAAHPGTAERLGRIDRVTAERHGAHLVTAQGISFVDQPVEARARLHEAVAAHGELPYDQSFIFVPLLSMGGEAKVENLHKRDTIASIQVAVDLQGVIGH